MHSNRLLYLTWFIFAASECWIWFWSLWHHSVDCGCIFIQYNANSIIHFAESTVCLAISNGQQKQQKRWPCKKQYDRNEAHRKTVKWDSPSVCSPQKRVHFEHHWKQSHEHQIVNVIATTFPSDRSIRQSVVHCYWPKMNRSKSNSISCFFLWNIATMHAHAIELLHQSQGKRHTHAHCTHKRTEKESCNKHTRDQEIIIQKGDVMTQFFSFHIHCRCTLLNR